MEKNLTNMNLKEIYELVELQLEKVDFNLLWNGFSKMEFALYNKDRVQFKNEEITRDERFVGNTSISYNGRNLAIGNIENIGADNVYILTYLMIHEMFHSHQLANGEIRFPDDLKGLYYPKDLKNYEIKHLENRLLVKALNEKNKDIKMDILKEFIGLRMARIEKYGDVIKYELALETLEGSAEYSGMKAYKIMCQEAYNERVESYKKLLNDDIKILFNIRKISYYVGTLFLFLLDELDIDFTKEIRGQNKYIFEQIADKIQYNKINIEEVETIEIEKYFIEYTDNIKSKIDNFFTGNLETHIGYFKICGYDPMNMIKYENNVLCSTFIKLINMENKNEIFLQGPIVIELKSESHNEVVKYHISKK